MAKTALVVAFTTVLLVSGLTAVAQVDLRTGVKSMHRGSALNVDPRTMMGSASAFDVATYHRGANLFCSQCHTMHASETHAGLASEPGAYPRTYTPQPKLLKAADPVTLCLTCHDNQAGIPDVVGADVNGLNERAAGLFGMADMPNDNGHKIATGIDPNVLCERCHADPNNVRDASGFVTASVSCIDCHNPHGNGRARNLQWASWPGGEYPFGYYVRPGSTGLSRYESSNIGYPAPNGTNFAVEGVEVTNMCIDCHHAIFNNTDIDTTHVKHPVYNSEWAERNTISQGDAGGSTVSSHWISGSGAGFLQTPRVHYVVRGATDFATSTTVAATNGVFCLSCHKAHGSNEPFGLVFHWTPGGEGCDQCHNKSAI
ncbi:hypothetical protein C3F09_02045 [candidate division GN15 bacterium]|uniref:Doubled CXXCH motif domain-containing protein n=1 Tax=candidate division GN15 bacterium TaxID=2072418 RepID=A0A855X6M8_9BACT|nr:MAG: hypothetical protein C3F09_02045 [candidate division GN15 bacterium]